MKKISQSLWFNVVVIVALTLFGLGIALYDSYELALKTIQNVNLLTLAMILAWGILPVLLWGASLTLMARQIRPQYSFKQGIANAFIGSFMAGMTPSSTGGQLAQTTTFKRQGLTTSQGAGLIWMDFYLYSVALVGVTLCLFVWKFSDFESMSITLIFGLSVLINVLIILVLGVMVKYPDISRKISHWIVEKISKTRWVKKKEEMIASWKETMDHFHSAMVAVHDRKSILGVLMGLNVARLLIYFSSPFAIAKLLGIEIPINQYGHLLALAGFVSMANTFVPLPGASGATESVFVLSFSTVLGKAAAASTMILWRFSTFHFVLFIGGYLYLHNRHTHLIKHHRKKKETPHEENPA